MYYHNDGLVRWTGAFGQLEYNYKDISAFINVTGSQTSYKRIDYFKKQDLVFNDTILFQAVGINDTINYNGTDYTIDSQEARYTQSNWERLFQASLLKLVQIGILTNPIIFLLIRVFYLKHLGSVMFSIMIMNYILILKTKLLKLLNLVMVINLEISL